MSDKLNTLVKVIKENKIKAIFGVPGSGITLSLIDKLDKIGIPFYLTHFEGSAALMAAIFGKISNSPGLSLSIKGPGLTNSVSGISAASFENFPLVHACESYDYNSRKSLAHKRVNHRIITNQITKGSFFLNNSTLNIRRLFSLTKEEEPGPVLLEMSSKYSNKTSFIKKNKKVRYKDSFSINLIKKSKKPIVIAGSLTSRLNKKDLFDKLNIPIFTTLNTKGVINENLNNSAGVFTGVGLSLTPEYNLIPASDLVICIGLNAKEVLRVNKFNCKSINIEAVDSDGINGFCFDSRSSMSILNHTLDILKEKTWGLNLLSKVKEKLDKSLFNEFLPALVFKEVYRFFKNFKVRVIFDTGYFCTVAEHVWKSKSTNESFFSGNGRYMGTSIPMAIGASLQNKNLPTIVFMGDGGIGMFISEIKLASENNLPILFILMSDGGFGSIRTRAIKKNFSQKHLIIKNSNWISVFEAFGINSAKCENINSLLLILKSWNFKNGPAFVEINFSPSKYQSMLNKIR